MRVSVSNARRQIYFIFHHIIKSNDFIHVILIFFTFFNKKMDLKLSTLYLLRRCRMDTQNNYDSFFHNIFLLNLTCKINNLLYIEELSQLLK